MGSTSPGRARPLSIIAALTLIILSLGVGGTAFADPGNGNSSGTAAQESTASSEAAAPASESAAAASADATTDSPRKSDAAAEKSDSSAGKSSSAPGQNKDSAADGQAGDHVDSGTAGTSGDVSSPQPISTADDNEGGANGQCPKGPYCSTRDGSPSLNGQGDGKAVGKPCAGCVGKADNKNPKGQMPNGSDHNAGYECDRNNGIGKTNPAHTGCKAPLSPPPPLPPPGEEPPGEDCAEPGPPACPEPPKGEDCEAPGPPACPEPFPEDCDEPGPPACPEPPVDRPRPPTDIAGVDDERPESDDDGVPPGALPDTGAPAAMGFVGAGGVLLVTVGGLTLWLQRRRWTIS